MGNSGWGGPPSEETQKANFRKCLQKECVPQALQLRSVAEMGTKFGMVTPGRPETRLDPGRSEAAQLAARAETGLLACEHQCSGPCPLKWQALPKTGQAGNDPD
eukprot:s1231_g2.t2